MRVTILPFAERLNVTDWLVPFTVATTCIVPPLFGVAVVVAVPWLSVATLLYEKLAR
jgi:hypothetical protein